MQMQVDLQMQAVPFLMALLTFSFVWNGDKIVYVMRLKSWTATWFLELANLVSRIHHEIKVT